MGWLKKKKSDWGKKNKQDKVDAEVSKFVFVFINFLLKF